MSMLPAPSGLRWIAPALLALSLAACVPPIDRPEIGRLRVVGPEVTVNGASAIDGMTIRSGDKLATGRASSAYVDLAGGGVVQLDENTDPYFERIREEGRCQVVLYVRFVGRIFGWASEQSGSCSIRVVSSNSVTQFGSSVHFDFSPRRDVLTLIEGRANLIEPETITLAPREQVTVAEGRVVELRRVTPAEIRDIRAWQERFPRPPAFRAPDLTGLGELLGPVIEGVLERTERAPPTPPPSPGRPPDHPVRAPNLIGQSVEAAQRLLEASDLQLGRQDAVRNFDYEFVTPGTILRQHPAPGTELRVGSAVDVWIAQRLPETSVSVPNLQGLTLDAARGALADAGLQLGRQDVVRHFDGPPYRVAGQHPALGTRVPRGTVVDLRLEGSLR